VLDHRPLGTAELVLLCLGKATIQMSETTQQLACLHYVQGFLDSHVLTLNYLNTFQEKGDPTVKIPKGITSCIDLDKVSAKSLLALFFKR